MTEKEELIELDLSEVLKKLNTPAYCEVEVSAEKFEELEPLDDSQSFPRIIENEEGKITIETQHDLYRIMTSEKFEKLSKEEKENSHIMTHKEFNEKFGDTESPVNIYTFEENANE